MTRRLCALGWVGMVWSALAGAAAAAEPLRAGVATVDITPPVPYRMSGYFSERLSTGIRDPLHAKAVVFRQGDAAAALVFCDLIGLSRQVSQAAREQARQATGIPLEHIVITATHSHTGPLYTGVLREHFHRKAVAEHGRDPHEAVDYPAELTKKLAQAIREADAAARPVELHAGYAREERLAFNRRFHMKNGTVQFNPGQLNPNIVRAAGPIDPEVGLIEITPADADAPTAAIVSFALHLDTLGGTEYSADYPRYVQDELRKVYGKEFVSLFGAGTCGDINHIDVSVKGRRPTAEIGTLLGQTVARQLPELPPITQPSLAVRRAVVDWPLQQYGPDEVQTARETMERVGDSRVPFLERVKAAKITDLQNRGTKTLPLEVQAFRLGPELAIVTLPGEIFVELGLAIKQDSPFKTTLVIELANDAPGYIPTRKAFAEGSYETVNSRVQSGGGEALVEAAGRLLKELNSP